MSSSIDAGFTTARLTGDVVRVGDFGYEAAPNAAASQK
jgi:hypothetical protein